MQLSGNCCKLSVTLTVQGGLESLNILLLGACPGRTDIAVTVWNSHGGVLISPTRKRWKHHPLGAAR